MANPWDNDPVVGGKTSSPEEFAKVYGPVAERISKAFRRLFGARAGASQ